jgi:hypothetical protein
MFFITGYTCASFMEFLISGFPDFEISFDAGLAIICQLSTSRNQGNQN